MPKTAAKKTAAKSKDVVVEMSLARTTKNTYRFEADDEDAAISTLYVNQSAFATAPDSITVTVS